MKYKVGDRVRIKSLDWYNENKDDNHEIRFENGIFTTLKSTFLGQIMTIELITLEKQYILMEDKYKTLWTDEMIEGLVEEETLIERVDDKGLPFNEWLSHKGAFHIPDGYELKDENGNVINATKIVLKKKSPKTDDIIKWLREHDMTKYIGVIYSGMCSITFDTEKLIKDITEMIGDE